MIDTDVTYPWWDPEFWGPVGLGCEHCYVEPAITRLGWGSLGFMCVARWFPRRCEEWMMGWLYRQRVEHLRLQKLKEHDGNRGHQLAFPMMVAA